jgi:hypothetical protein
LFSPTRSCLKKTGSPSSKKIKIEAINNNGDMNIKPIRHMKFLKTIIIIVLQLKYNKENIK